MFLKLFLKWLIDCSNVYLILAGMKPGVVAVVVTKPDGNYLGNTLFTYVGQEEKEEEVMANLLSNRRKLGKFFKLYAKTFQKKGIEDEETKSIPPSGELNCLTV